PMIPMFRPTARGKNLADVLPHASSAELRRAIEEASRSNLLTSCRFSATPKNEEREYEARIISLNEEEVLVAIRDLTAEQWIPSVGGNGDHEVRRPRVVRENLYGLTFREVGVLELMANGASDKEIARQLNVSV